MKNSFISNSPKKVGITGCIGSGKSVVCDIFKTLGVKIYNADLQARELLDKNQMVKQQIISTFGVEVYQSGMVDRKLLAGKVFNNPEALQKLNSIVHPAVFNDFNQWMEANKHEAYVIKEAAIMFESGTNKLLDIVVLVYSPPEIRLERVIKRDKTDKDAVLARMKNQMDDSEKIKLSDFVIYNDNDHSLIQQVLHLHNIFNK